jgi:hypothetical protein
MQWTKCIPHVSNLCPHSHMRTLDVKGLIKPNWKCNIEVKIKCVMRNERIYGLTTNHNPIPLPEQEWMQILDAKEMESSSKIYLKDVSWCKSIKDSYRFGALVITRFLKKRCISLVVKGSPSCATCRQEWNMWASIWKTYSSKIGLSKIWNLEHKCGATRAQLFKNQMGHNPH